MPYIPSLCTLLVSLISNANNYVHAIKEKISSVTLLIQRHRKTFCVSGEMYKYVYAKYIQIVTKYAPNLAN